ncbi:AMSH-like ubiquitin thioesterase 3 [Striga hermonthica]|uniref:AMSH-like ubiquitin thioesterase 3 n=1 Tax=Striga hermonthica TaxID=68872 RepID=A0A9N7RMG2_STRHE|nr:AMSH-like ubiquitin thioesterase 3 [Striga hermonthica]
MRRPAYSSPSLYSIAMNQKIDVDNRICLRVYYRTADNLLKQANIYREEKNLKDLFVMLLRYSFLVSETIPSHSDYQTLCPKERSLHMKKVHGVLDELETLKPKVSRQMFDPMTPPSSSLKLQPSPPSIMARVQPEALPVSPSKVADPRPGPHKLSEDGLPGSNSYRDLHIPVKIMEDFLKLARENTAKNLETCGILVGPLENSAFRINTLIIPKQTSTSYSCEALNEEEIFDVQAKHSVFPLGWIHTHPTQTCFMSSIDLHTQYAYQIMLPEAIAIVMAPTDTSSPHGIFHLSDPGGVSVIRNCQQRGFHSHEEPEDGTPIYEHCSHVYMNSNLKFDVVDLRRDEQQSTLFNKQPSVIFLRTPAIAEPAPRAIVLTGAAALSTIIGPSLVFFSSSPYV